MGGRTSAGRAVIWAAVALVAALAAPASTAARAAVPPDFDTAVAAVLALPYNPGAAPVGLDGAFGADDYPAAFPLTDLAGGACCSGPVPDQPPLADLAPPFADFPDGFDLVELASYDGTPLHAFAALRPGAPGIVVMHGFNTNGKHSIVRYAAFLYANGYSVIAPDHRDMGREWARGGSWHPDGTRHGQSFGWKEAQDLLTAAEWLAARGTRDIGVLGFSEGAQNTILALGIDYGGLIDAALTFSAPADQRSLAARSPATTAALLATVVGNPDICGYLAGVGARPEFAATPNFMLRQDSAVDTLDGVVGGGVRAPALHLYTNDDTLVPPWNATALASRTNAMPEQHTVLLASGNHAYFADRWWTQMAALTWFGEWLDPDGVRTTRDATVTRTPGGPPAGDQQLDLGGVTRGDGDAELRRADLCAPGEATGPTAHLAVSGEGADFTLDGRRSYSGWEDHEIASWSIDPGDGAPVTSGGDIHEASVAHRYDAPGTYTATLTVVDDTGRRDEATATVTATHADEPPAGEGRVHGSGWWDRGSGHKHDKVDFSFDAKHSTHRLQGKLQVKDKDRDTKIDATTITSLSTGAGVDCDGTMLDGAASFAFTATGTFEVGGVETEGAEFLACGIDNGKTHEPPVDYFSVECTAGCSYSTGPRVADNGIDGGNIHLHDPIAPDEAAGASPDDAEQGVLTLDPLLLDTVPAGTPLVLVAVAESPAGQLAATDVALRWETTGGATGTATLAADAAGVATFVVIVPPGDVAYTASVGTLDSNGVRITGTR